VHKKEDYIEPVSSSFSSKIGLPPAHRKVAGDFFLGFSESAFLENVGLSKALA
jgi:hypothetical protein